MQAQVWGCLECGAMSTSLTNESRCPECKHGLVTELGGEPTPEKAQALLAWARRDATEQIENRGTLLGAAGGFAFGALTTALSDGGLAVGLFMLYACVLGGLLGRLLALAGYRRLWPSSRLQPVFDANVRRRLKVAIGAWVLLPAISATLLLAFGSAGGVAHTLKRLVGRLWAVLAG